MGSICKSQVGTGGSAIKEDALGGRERDCQFGSSGCCTTFKQYNNEVKPCAIISHPVTHTANGWQQCCRGLYIFQRQENLNAADPWVRVAASRTNTKEGYFSGSSFGGVIRVRALTSSDPFSEVRYMEWGHLAGLGAEWVTPFPGRWLWLGDLPILLCLPTALFLNYVLWGFVQGSWVGFQACWVCLS